jgi:hypothetical protein
VLLPVLAVVPAYSTISIIPSINSRILLILLSLAV